MKLSIGKMPTYDCRFCQHRYTHTSDPVVKCNARMQPGIVYCTGGTRAKRFLKKDLKKKPPVWCPLRKTNMTVYLYDFKTQQDAYMFNLLRIHNTGRISADSDRYTLVKTTETRMTLDEFFHNPTDPPGITVPLWTVIGFDDGLCTAYFFKMADGYRYEPYFNR